MGIKNTTQAGFHIAALLVAIVFIGLIGFIAWRVFIGNYGGLGNGTATQGFVEWSFDGNEWRPVSTAPACENPLTIASPLDVSKATSVLLPGQMRGTDFKPHGGIGLDNATSNNVNVYTLMDGYLYRGSRYIEGGAVQYMFDIMSSCGVMFRFDHLATLSDTFAEYARQLPEPKVDDSRTTRLNPVFVKKGTLVATAIGITNPLNVFFDVGVYDLRQRNEASKTAIYQTDSKRIDDKEQSFFAVCWFDLLPAQERAIVKALPPRGGDKESTSDYCD